MLPLSSPLLNPAPLTQTECIRRYDRAIRTRDGALLRSVLHPKITAASPATGPQVARFLKGTFWPALAKSGVKVRGGGFVPLTAKNNYLHYVFTDSGRVKTEIRNPGDPAPLFTPAVLKTSDGYRAVTDYARLIFFAAAQRANSPTRNEYEEILDAQTLVEKWAPGLDGIGIKGGFDGIASPFQPWRILLPTARKELDAMKKGSGDSALATP